LVVSGRGGKKWDAIAGRSDAENHHDDDSDEDSHDNEGAKTKNDAANRRSR